MVHNGLPVNSVQQLVALARSKPGELNYASSGLGASNHLAAERFKSMAGVDIVRIGYKGASPGLNDLMAGRIHVMFPTAGAAMPLVKLGRVKALAVTGLERSRIAPDLPTVAESGLPGYESLAIYGVFAPAGTPRPIVEHLHKEIVRVLAQPAVTGLIAKLGMETVGSSPAELSARSRTR